MGDINEKNLALLETGGATVLVSMMTLEADSDCGSMEVEGPAVAAVRVVESTLAVHCFS